MDTDTITPDEEAMELARQAQVLSVMREDGVATEESFQDDDFGFEEMHRVTLPDGKSWVEHQTLTEGARKQYLNAQNRDVTIEKVSGNARLKMQTGDERMNLLRAAIKNWNLVRRGQPVKFSPTNLNEFLENANPKIIDLIERDIRKHNPWLMADATVEDIDTQIAELYEMRANKVKENEGKES